MEIMEDLKIGVLRRDLLKKSFDEASALASSIFLFTVKWKELEDHFDETNNHLQKQAHQLLLRERLLEDATLSLQQQVESQDRDFRKRDEEHQTRLTQITHQIELLQVSHLNLQNSIEDCNKKLLFKQNDFNALLKSVKDCDGELVLKREQLCSTLNELDKYRTQVNLKEEELKSVNESVKCARGELQKKDRELVSLKRRLDICLGDLSAKDGELVTTKQNLGHCKTELEQCCIHLHSKKDELKSVDISVKSGRRELQMSEEDLAAVKGRLKTCHEDLSAKDGELVLKKKELSQCKNELEQCSKHLHSKKEELKSVENSIKGCTEDLQLMEGNLSSFKVTLDQSNAEISARDGEICLQKDQLRSAQNEFEECSRKIHLKKVELNSMEKAVDNSKMDLEVNEKRVNSLQKWHDDLCEKISAKDRELSSKKEKLGLAENELGKCYEELGLQKEELNSTCKSVQDHRAELQLTERKLTSAKTKLQEHSMELELKKKEHTMVSNNLECEENKLNMLQKLIDESQIKLDSITKQVKAEISTQENKKQTGQNTSVDERRMNLLLAEHLMKQDQLYAEVKAKLSRSPDPAKLVLDQLHPNAWKENIDTLTMGRTCVLLLEQLMKFSPVITPQVKEDSMKLAHEWKAKLGALPGNSTQVLCFMLLLAAFKLFSIFKRDELLRLIDVLGQQRQVPELLAAIENAHPLPVSNMPFLVKVEKTEHCTLNRQRVLPSEALELHAKQDIDELQMILHKGDTMQQEALDALRISPDPLKMVLDLMKELLYQHWKKENTMFEMSRNCILSMDQAVRVSKKIHQEVKLAASKLAFEWKLKLKVNADNNVEILVFLVFMASFELASFFLRKDISRLLDFVTPHRKAPELSWALGFADKIPGIIEHRIARKQHLEAVGIICRYKLADKFPRESLLKQHCSDIITNRNTSPKEKKEAIDEELAAIKSLMECVKDNKLESIFSTVNIRKRQVELEKQKEVGTDSVTAANVNESLPKEKLEQRGSSKRLRKDEPLPSNKKQLACRII